MPLFTFSFLGAIIFGDSFCIIGFDISVGIQDITPKSLLASTSQSSSSDDEYFIVN